MKKTKKLIFRVISSPWEEDEDLPWEYDEDGFVSWYDEVFEEGYKKEEDASFPSVEEALDGLEEAGYVVEVVEAPEE